MKFFLLVLGVLVVAFFAVSAMRRRTETSGSVGSTRPPAPRPPAPSDAPGDPVAAPQPIGSAGPLDEPAGGTSRPPTPPAAPDASFETELGTGVTGSQAAGAATSPKGEAMSPEDEGPAADAAAEDPGPDADALHEIRDGGYGVGSAAPLGSGEVPLGHPVKAWNDTHTFMTPDHPHYRSADPHVWFTDAEAAHRAGFVPAEG